MSIEISKMSQNKLNILFIDKYIDYLSIMSNFMSPEKIEERKRIVLNNFRNLSTNFHYQKKEHELYSKLYDKFEKNVRFLDLFAQIDYEYVTSKNSLEKIFENEISFLDYITTDFELSNGQTHGIQYKSSDGKIHYDGINRALTYSIINNVAFGKGDEFEYPEEMKPSENASLYQVKDSLAIDMMDVFGLDIVEDFFLGNGAKFNKDFRHAFMVYTTTEDEVSTDEEIAKRTIQNMKDFEDGVDKSIKKNDESFYSRYVDMMKKLKGVVKTTNFEYADEVYNRVKRGLK